MRNKFIYNHWWNQFAQFISVVGAPCISKAYVCLPLDCSMKYPAEIKPTSHILKTCLLTISQQQAAQSAGIVEYTDCICTER